MNEMNIEKAIEILELHNKWRRDNDGKYEMAEPKELGKAIDLVVSEFKNLHLQSVSFSLPNEGEIQKLYKDEMKKWKGTSWHTELECHGELFTDGAKAVVAYLKGNES